MELWYTEKQTENLGYSCRITKTLHTEQTDFQKLDMIETVQWGTMLVLDGMVMTTDKDEFVYHEMITHVALNTHPAPKKVMVIGGGDGGAIREIVKHPSVEKATLVEIDRRVVELSKEYLPQIASALEDPKVEVLYEDGIKHIKERKNYYDIILVDSTEPVGPAVGLFSEDFYQAVSDALKEDGIMVAQSESPFINAELITEMFSRISGIFPITRLYTVNIPTYPSGMWSFTMGSKKYDPLTFDDSKELEFETKYYTAKLHKAAFQLPKFVQDLTKVNK